MRWRTAFCLLAAGFLLQLDTPDGHTDSGLARQSVLLNGDGRKSAEDEEQGEGSRSEWTKWFIQQRAYPLEEIPFGARERAVNYVRQAMRPSAGGELLRAQAPTKWEPIGPETVTNGQTAGGSAPVSGRVTSIAVDPRDSNTIYAGAAGGGVWKTTNAGVSWKPLTDTQSTLAIGSLAIDPVNPNIVYAGTGEGNLSGDCYFGAGLLKSTNGGDTWKQLGSSTFAGLALADLVIDPTNTQVLYAGVTIGVGGLGGGTLPNAGIRGAYKSTDAGETWRRMMGGLPGPNTNGVLDLAMDPTNAQVLYAGFYRVGIFKTTNGGTTWTRPATSGFPDGFGRISVAIAPSNNQTIYSALEDASSGDLLDIVKSTNGGTTWTTLSQLPGGGTLCQCAYDNVIAVAPTNPNVVFFGAVRFYRSNNGGGSWSEIAAGSRIHVDFHAITFDPSNSNKVYVGNDGGVWSSSNGGNTWANLNSNLGITQFNYIAPHPTDVKVLYGGTQDNGTLKYTGAAAWSQARGGDGGAVVVDFQAPNTVYHTFFFLSFERSDNGGISWATKQNGITTADRSLFYIPVVMDPSDSKTLYLGSFRLYKTTNRGDNWRAISPDLSRVGTGSISTIAVAPSSPMTIYVGTSDGNVQVTHDGGITWKGVISGLPGRYVSRLLVDESNPLIVYAALSGFRSGHVFKTVDGGATWKDISGNLPDIPANAIALDNADPDRLFVGTDAGVFVTSNDGVSWDALNDGLPNTIVVDLSINERTNSLFAATHGRSVYRLPLAATP